MAWRFDGRVAGLGSRLHGNDDVAASRAIGLAQGQPLRVG